MTKRYVCRRKPFSRIAAQIDQSLIDPIAQQRLSEGHTGDFVAWKAGSLAIMLMSVLIERDACGPASRR